MITFSLGSLALACKCPHRSPPALLKQSRSIFLGVATKETVDGHIYFKIQKTWKGLENQQEVDLKFRNFERCGVNPTMGHSYLVFVKRDRIDSCSIKEAVFSDKEVTYLNRHKTP